MATIAATSLTMSACGGGDTPDASGEEPVPAPSAAEFPKPGQSLESLLSEVGETNQLAVLPSGGTFEPGDDRFGFGIFDVGGAQLLNADAAIYAAHGDSKPIGPLPARVESLETKPAYTADSLEPTDAKVVYVADVPFSETGEWRLVAAVRDSKGVLAATRLPSVVVDEYPDIPDVGDPAPDIHTPTIDDVGPANIAEIDTRRPASTMHDEDFAQVVGKKPAVLLFATPALCMSRVCGPVTDVAEQVKAEYGDKAAFIHMEIYEDNVPGEKNLRDQVKAYGLFSEPWLFVVDENGDVETRIEGAFSVDELEDALEPLVN